MFKKALICIMACGMALSAAAVPAKPGLRTFTQPDGSTLSVQLVGDENAHMICTPDGLALSRDAEGFLCYRGTAVRVHDIALRTPAEMALISEMSDQLREMPLQMPRRAAAAAAPQRVSQVPCTGSPRIPVLLVQYTDYKFKDSDPAATFHSFFTEGEKSCHQYFVDQSNSLYTPQFDVYGPFTLSSKRVTYGGNDSYGYDKGVGKMVAEGCLGLNSQIDFSRYDNDGDGECDVVIVLYAGDGEASSYEDDYEDSVWPCQWDLSSSDYGKSLTLDNTKVNKFAVFNELNGADLSLIDGIGTFCHEYSHCLDLPDFYDTNYGNHFGMGPWSLLDYGCYNDDGYTPVGYTAYEKSFMGWLEIEEAKENTQYILPIFNSKNILADKAIKITNPADANEYFILENRAQQGWDKYMPAQGLFIYHVTYNTSSWANNTVNNYTLQRMTPVPADNSLKMVYSQGYYQIDEASLKGDLWPYGSAREWTDDTAPAAVFNTGGKKVGKPVTEITRNADGTVSFWVAKSPRPTLSTPVLGDHSVLSSSSFMAAWSPVEGDVTYTVELREHQDITYSLICSVDFSDDEHGWTTSGYTTTADNEDAIRLGSSNRTGSIKSPVLATDGQGILTVRYNARSYGSDNSSIVVTVADGAGIEIESVTTALTDTFEDYCQTFNIGSASNVTVTFSTTAAKKRVYVATADIYNGDASTLAAAPARAASSAVTVSGIVDAYYTFTDLADGGKYDYRVKAEPVDATEYDPSDWTDYATVDLAGSSIIDLTAPADTPAVYYNLQGIAVDPDNLRPGIYVIIQNGVPRKAYIK